VGEVCFDELRYEEAMVTILGKGIRYGNALLQCGIYPTEIFWWDGKVFKKGVSGENRWFGFGKRLGWALMERNGLELWCLNRLLDRPH
jgi:hypothetical protein